MSKETEQEVLRIKQKNKLISWVKDGCPPIVLNDHPGEVVRLVETIRRLSEALKTDHDAMLAISTCISEDKIDPDQIQHLLINRMSSIQDLYYDGHLDSLTK